MLLHLYLNKLDAIDLQTVTDAKAVYLHNWNEFNYYEDHVELIDSLLEKTFVNNIPFFIINGTGKNVKPLWQHDYDSQKFVKYKKYKHFLIENWDTYWISKWYYSWKLSENDILVKSLDRDYFATEYNTNFEYLAMCLNNQVKNHRVYLVDNLAKYGMLESTILSWHSYKLSTGCDLVNCIRSPWKHWQPKIVKLEDDYPNDFGSHIPPRHFDKIFVDIVNETTTTCVYLTEKIVFALNYCKLFLVNGAPGYHAYLKLLGFELYDEVFDYSFDNVEDDLERAEMIVQQVKSFHNVKFSLNSIYNKVFDKIVHNKRNFLQIAQDYTRIPLTYRNLLNIDPSLFNTTEWGNDCKKILDDAKNLTK
ncbi:MAG: hypothetical protein EBU90_07830 [Proteobacteria bacterium]|nr:hypothetical protein [Pseudomonadota bacterium]NBP14108.1 hypothetical protein [bacterium]